MGRFDAAVDKLDRALDALDRTSGEGVEQLRIRVLITRSWTELEVNGLGPALRMLHDARARATAVDDRLLIALSHVQEGVIHVRGGNWAACLVALDQVGDDERVLEPGQLCALLINRGMAHLSLGHSAEADADLSRAVRTAAEHGLVDQEFKARHNLACLAFVDGDLPRALVLMRAADRMDASVARDRARLDHGEVLLEAGLVDRARDALGDALDAARRDGHRLEEGEISARLARCDLLTGDLAGARRHIKTAMAAYRTRQVHELLRDATLIRSTIDVAAGHDLPGVVGQLARRNDAVDAVGAPRTSADRRAVRLEAEARLLLDDPDGADRRLATLTRTNRESLADRLHDVLVRARLDHARGRQVDAERRITTGNRLLAAHQFQSSSLDVRAALALHGRRLAAFDVDRALAAGDDDGILTSIERWRAISHRINPVTTPRDPEITTRTRELRRLRHLAADGDAQAADGLAVRIAALEEEVSQREWSLTVTQPTGGATGPVDADEARATAADRSTTVVEFFEVGDRLWTVVLADGEILARPTGTVSEVSRLVTRLRRDLRGRAIVATGSPMAPMLERATAASLAALDAALNPTGATDARVAVIPSRTLAAVPWSLLPSLRGRPVTVAPSLTRWVRGPSTTAGTRWSQPVAALYGPGLSRSGPEIRAIRAAWSGSDDGGEITPASSEDVLRALGSARVVHLAAHGIHEAQSPLFSSVQVADGPVFAHEFPRPVAAEHVALSACDVGQFSTRPGDEPLGLAIALLSLGATSVLGAVAPVADHVAAEAMVAYHRLVAGGADASTAWGSVVEQQPAAGVFCYYGSEWSVAADGS